MPEIVDLGAAKLDPATNAVTFQCKGPKLSDQDDAPDYGNAPVMQCLGVTSVPYQADEDGGAQGVVVDVPGFDGVVVGARDTRSAAIYGNLKPGDTCVHSTGPQQAAQLLLKEDKRQAVLASKDSQGFTMVHMLDGKNDKVQIAAFGMIFELSRENGICAVSDTGGAGIQIKGDVVSIFGTVVLGGRTPTAPVMAGPSAPGAPAPGVFVGS